MSYSRRQLYAVGEAFGDCATRSKLGGGRVFGGGDSSETTQGATTVTTNTDQRMAIQDGIGTNGDGNNVFFSSNSTDAVAAIADMGASVIKDSGAAVVELYKDAGNRNVETWDKTLTEGGKLVDRLIDKVGDGFALSSKVVDSFQPNENKNVDALRWAAIAAGVVGVAYFMQDKK